MPERVVIIGSRTGLHARPAMLFVKAAGEASIPVRISVAGRTPVDARSMLAVLSLGAAHGVEVTLYAEGEGVDAVLDDLAAMLSSDLDAEPASS